MKKLLLLFVLLLFFSVPMLAQDYEPMLKPGSFWDFEVWGDAAGGPSPCAHSQRRYLVDQDTLINGHQYKKVIEYPLQGTPDPNFPACLGSNLYYSANIFTIADVFLREDIDEQTVYIWARVQDPTNNNNTLDYDEYILYKYNVEVGDIIPKSYARQDNFWHSAGIEITETITSVIIDTDGKKVIGTDHSSYKEGVGTEYDLFKFGPTLSPSQFLYCNGSTANPNSCSSILSVVDEQLAQIKIFPNPTADKISLTNLEDNTFKLYSILGNEVSFQFSQENEEIDISHLTQGMYFLEIRGNNNSKRIVKVIKN